MLHMQFITKLMNICRNNSFQDISKCVKHTRALSNMVVFICGYAVQKTHFNGKNMNAVTKGP